VPGVTVTSSSSTSPCCRTRGLWHRRDEWDTETLAAYRRWIGLRREHPALRHGGLRWLHVGDHSLTYLREHPDETLLVHVTRAPAEPVTLPVASLGARVRDAVAVAGAPPLLADGRLTLPGDGPAAYVSLVA
jgi:alpha-glucosidase